MRQATLNRWTRSGTPPAMHGTWYPRVGVTVVKALSDIAPPARPLDPSPRQSNEPGECVVCHDDDVIRQQRLTRAQWDAELNKMIGWGANVKDEDRGKLLDYLSSNFGPRRR